MIERGRQAADEELRLLGRRLDHDATAGGTGCRQRRLGRQRGTRHRAEQAARLGGHLGRRDLAADRQRHALRTIERAIPGYERPVIDAAQGLPRTEARQRVGMRAIDRGVELVERAGRRVVAAALQTREQPVALAIDLLRREPGLQRQLGGELQQLPPEARQRGGLDAGVVDVAGRADLAAEPGHRLGQLAAAPLRRPLHHHGVGEVRDAGVVARLPARSHADQQRDGHDRCHRILAHDHRQPVVEPRRPHVLRRRLGGREPGRGQHRHHEQRHRQPAPGGHRAPVGTKRTRARLSSPRYLRAAAWIWAAVTWRSRSR